MKKIIETTQVQGNKFKRAYEEVSIKDTSSKAKIRKDIQDIRGDLYDIVADNLKWNSILTDLVRRMWSVIPEEQKATLTSDDKYIIDTFLTVFAQTQTRMDKQIQAEGVVAIEKLLTREKLVGELFSGSKL